jgi:hypothetical protein
LLGRQNHSLRVVETTALRCLRTMLCFTSPPNPLFNANLKSGADTDLARRIRSAGYEVIYANLAVVRRSARIKLIDLRAKRRRLMGGRWAALGCKQRHLPRLL